MPNKPLSEMPDPTNLYRQGLNLETITGVQVRNIDTARRMATLIFDSAEAITERQAAFFKAGVDRMNAAFEREDGASDPRDVFERQSAAYRDLFGAFASHVSELTGIVSECCTGLVHEASGNFANRPMKASRTARKGPAGNSSKAESRKK